MHVVVVMVPMMVELQVVFVVDAVMRPCLSHRNNTEKNRNRECDTVHGDAPYLLDFFSQPRLACLERTRRLLRALLPWSLTMTLWSMSLPAMAADPKSFRMISRA